MLSAIMKSPEVASQVVLRCMDRGLILFFLLFEKRAARITPPLTISKEEVKDKNGKLGDIFITALTLSKGQEKNFIAIGNHSGEVWIENKTKNK